MFAFLMRLLFFLSLFIYLGRLLKRLWRGMPGRAADSNPGAASGPANLTVKDPVCGMYLDPRLAIRVQGEKGAFHFCSEQCRDQFMSNPGQFRPEEKTRNASR